MSKRVDRTGQVFNQLTVIKMIDPNPNAKPDYKCMRALVRCECGIEKIIKSNKLGRQKNCGIRKHHMDPSKDYKISSAKQVYFAAYKDGDLTFEQFYEMSQQNCFYCGKKPSNSYSYFKPQSKNPKDDAVALFTYNGLDRLDSSKPHNLSNCVPSCKRCNYAKSNEHYNDYKTRIMLTFYNLFYKHANMVVL